MDARLYVIPGSHPSRTAIAMLELKGIPYKRVDLMPVISKGVLRAAGFAGITVPALKIDGRKLQGSREIARELDRIRPEPPLLPADPEARAAVERAEAWGDETLQPAARRILWNALRRDRSPLACYSEGARLGVPIGLAVKTGRRWSALSARLNEATDENVRADLAALPGMLQRVDDWIAEGVLGGEQPNAADLQIAASLRLLMTLRRPARADRRPPRRRAGDAVRARLPGRRAADPSRRLARAPAGYRGGLSVPTRSTRSPSRAAASASLSRVPSGSASSGSSSSSGTSTNRRERHLAGAAASAARSRARARRAAAGRRRAAAGRGAGRRTSGRARPRSPCRRRAAPRGSSSVSIRTAALRKSGWSRISPTGSVS